MGDKSSVQQNRGKLRVRIRFLMAQVRHLRRQVRQANALLEQRESIIKELKARAQYDELTGLHRRWVFQQNTEAILEGLNARPGSDPLAESTCLLLFDIKKFKQINEGAGGMAEGDRAIQAVAEALRRVFTRIGDIYCRFGGDEFAALVRGTTPEKVTEIVRETNVVLAKLYPRLVLRGAFVFYRPGMNFDDLYREVGIEMARIKRNER